MNTTKNMIAGLLMIAGFSVHYPAKAQQDIPAQVRSAAESKTGGYKITQWVSDRQGGKYIATVLNKETFRIIEIDTKGKWLRTSQAFQPDSVPDIIIQALAAYVKDGYETDNYTLVEDAAKGTYYTVDLTSDDDDTTLYLSTEGKVIKKEKR